MQHIHRVTSAGRGQRPAGRRKIAMRNAVRKAAMKRAAEDRGVSKREIYTALYVPQGE